MQQAAAKKAALANTVFASRKSLIFDGLTDYMANFNLFGVSTFPIRNFNRVTVSKWVKSEKASAATEQVIIGRWYPTPGGGLSINEGGWRWYLWDTIAPTVSRALVFQVCTHFLQGIWIHSLASFPLNQWVHVVMTYDGSSSAAGLKMYWDGVQVPVNVIYANWTTTALNSGAYSHLLWGTQYTAWPSGGGPVWPPVLTWHFQGKMDESAFWRTDLNAAEVLHLANGGYPADPLHVGLPDKHCDRYFRMGDYSDGAPWVAGHSISVDRTPVGGTVSNGFWNNDGVIPSLRISGDVAP